MMRIFFLFTAIYFSCSPQPDYPVIVRNGLVYDLVEADVSSPALRHLVPRQLDDSICVVNQTFCGVCLPEQCDFDADCPVDSRCEGSSVCPPDLTCIWEGEPGVCVGTECREELDCPLGTTCSDGFCVVLAP